MFPTTLSPPHTWAIGIFIYDPTVAVEMLSSLSPKTSNQSGFSLITISVNPMIWTPMDLLLPDNESADSNVSNFIISYPSFSIILYVLPKVGDK